MMGIVIKRNIKMFFKDKGLFFTSLITPLILLVLYMTFLSDVYKDSFLMSVPRGFEVDEKLVDAMAGGQLVSSLLAVCGVTVAFCSNMLMVQDKVNGSAWDFNVTPLKPAVKAVGYYIASFVSTLIICLIAAGAGFAYLAAVGWYLSAQDVLFVLLDVFLLVMFGTALSSVINVFMSSQGQISAVGSIVSSCYGFICGAYMPISSFAEGLRTVLSYLPFTYATALLRNHAMRGAFAELEVQFEHLGLPDAQTEALLGGVDILRETVDSTVYFHGKVVPVGAMIALIGGVSALLMLIYLAMNLRNKKRVR